MFANSGRFATPPAVQNLIILNVLVFLAMVMLPNNIGDTMVEKFGLFYWESANFRPYQFVTYMFLHAGFMHLFTNMFALWMFGRTLEYDLGTKRFLIYYFVTGIGAGLIQLGVNAVELASLKSTIAQAGDIASAADMRALYSKINMVNIGASGAVFGILLAFGMIYPNATIMLIFFPVPIKAKYFVIGYGLIELFYGFRGGDGIAHFAHLGGMIFGFMLLKYWKKRGKIYY